MPKFKMFNCSVGDMMCFIHTHWHKWGKFQSKKLKIGKMLQKAELIPLLKIPLKGF